MGRATRLSMAKISVIVPIYRAEKFLDRCIGSLVQQTIRDMEIILVDDASPDRSGIVCEEWCARGQSERVKIVVVHREKNGGHSAARNSGLDIATGDYIGFVDSDDYVLPEMYERMLSVAERTNADVVQGGYHVVSSDGKDKIIGVEQSLVCENLASCPALLHQQTKFVWDKIFKRDMLIREKIRFQDDVHFHEDFLFLAEADVALHGYAVSGYAGYIYHVRREGASTTIFDERLLDCTKALYRICELLKNHEMWSITKDEVLKNALESFMLRIHDFNSYSNAKLQCQIVYDWWSFLNSNWRDWRKRLLSQIGSRGQRYYFRLMTIKPIVLLWAVMPWGVKSFVVSFFSSCMLKVKRI